MSLYASIFRREPAGNNILLMTDISQCCLEYVVWLTFNETGAQHLRCARAFVLQMDLLRPEGTSCGTEAHTHYKAKITNCTLS